MKAPSKLDQLRAMREDLASRPRHDQPRKEVVPDTTPRPVRSNEVGERRSRPNDKTQPPVVTATADRLGASDTVSDAVSDTVSSLAPVGECPYCDNRRAKSAEAVRLHRANKANRKITQD